MDSIWLLTIDGFLSYWIVLERASMAGDYLFLELAMIALGAA
jgi:hypothetical protein